MRGRQADIILIESSLGSKKTQDKFADLSIPYAGSTDYASKHWHGQIFSYADVSRCKNHASRY